MKFVNFFDDDYKMEVWNIVEPLILELKDLEFSYLVARDVKWADVKAHEGIVFENYHEILIHIFELAFF